MEVYVKNKKAIVSISLITLILLIGVSYAFFSYSRVGNKNSQLVTGDVYMHFKENGNEIILTNAFPETKEEAKLRNDNYMTFTISGKNTTKNSHKLPWSSSFSERFFIRFFASFDFLLVHNFPLLCFINLHPV